MSKISLTTVATRHQVLLERLKTQTTADFVAVLPKLDRAIRDVLLELDVSTMNELSARALNKVLADMRDAQAGLLAKAKDVLLVDLAGLARYEASFELRTLQSIVDEANPGNTFYNYTLQRTDAADAFAYAQKRPLSATGQLLEPFIDTWSDKQLDGVEQLVRKGWAEGSTVQDMATQVRGTRANGFSDGLIAASARQAEAMVRTSVQHVSQSAREATWHDNDDLVEGVIFIATLDGKTTQQCRSLDHKEFPLDSGPRPPLHINCRSTTIAKLPKEFDFLDEGATRSSMNGYVPADTTYYEWLKSQPASFQDEAIGASRGALFRSGGLSTDQFAKLNLGRNFQPLTLEQMASKEPVAFHRAGLDKYLPPKG